MKYKLAAGLTLALMSPRYLCTRTMRLPRNSIIQSP